MWSTKVGKSNQQLCGTKTPRENKVKEHLGMGYARTYTGENYLFICVWPTQCLI